MDELDFAISKLCISKGIIKKVKRQLTEQEKTFATYIADKSLGFRIYKELSQSTTKGQKNLIKYGKNFFSYVDIQSVSI